MSTGPVPVVDPEDQRPLWLSHLGLTPGATWPEIDRAYRQLISDATPAPESNRRVRRLAERFLSEVETAYAELRRLDPTARTAGGEAGAEHIG